MNRVAWIGWGLRILAVLGVCSLVAERARCHIEVDDVAAPMVVRYLQQKGYDDHYAYRYQLTQAALEITRAEFGDYQLAPYTASTSTARYAQLMSEGEQLNLMWVSPGTPVAAANVIEIPIDILKGLLGYRVCLINRKSALDFSAIKDVQALDGIKIGQALWPDRAIYHANQVVTVDAPYFDNLFMMLSAQRFDCIALGADEVGQIYDTQKDQYPFLAIDTHLLIHYDYPLYFYVSKQQPRLAERIALGLQMLRRNGEFDRLFYHHHAANVARLGLAQRNLVCLTSPYQPENKACVLPLVE